MRRILWVLLLGLALAGGEPAWAEAEPSAEQRRQLEQKARALNDQAVQRYQEGRFSEATKLLEQALALYKALYPKGKDPQAHPDLANSLNNLGVVMKAQGEYGRALDYYQQALALR